MSVLAAVFAFNGFTFNDQYYAHHMETAPHGWARVTSVDGVWGDGDIDSTSFPIAGGVGDVAPAGQRRGRTITITGEIHAAGIVPLYQIAKSMREAHVDQATYYPLGISLPAYYNEPDVYFNARVAQDLAITEGVADYDPMLAFVVTYRCDDPRSYKVSDDSKYPTWQP